jgi:hypothetical protein
MGYLWVLESGLWVLQLAGEKFYFECPFTLPGTSKLGVEQTALSTLKLLPGKLKDP